MCSNKNNVNNDLLNVVDCLKKIKPFKTYYKEEKRYTFEGGPYWCTEFLLYVDNSFLKYNNCREEDVLRYLATKSYILKNPQPMSTSNTIDNLERCDRATIELKNFDENADLLWIKEQADGECEYRIGCIDSKDYFEKIRKNLDRCFGIRVNKENCFCDYGRGMSKEEYIIGEAKMFFEEKYNEAVEFFVKNLSEKYSVSYAELLGFFQKLANHKDIAEEFFKVFLSSTQTGTMNFVPYYNISVKRQGLTAECFSKRYRLSIFNAYQYFVSYAEGKLQIIDQELLNEFLIKKYGDNYAVIATDKAYELLGLNKKYIIDERHGYSYDTISKWLYRVAFLNFLKNNYRIDGLSRTSKGNSHDASWETEVIVFNGEGFWKEKFDSYRNDRGGAYCSAVLVIDNKILDDELIENWCKDYDLSFNGEDEEARMVFCSYNDDSAHFCFSFKHCSVVATAATAEYKMKTHNNCEGSTIYLSRTKV